MLGRRDPQRSLFSVIAIIGVGVLRKFKGMKFYLDLGLNAYRFFKDQEYADAYSKVGRPSAPPSMLTVALLLKCYENVSDDEVINRLRFDTRWKVALDLPPGTETPFAKSTFQAFRVRLSLYAKEALVFEKTIKLARENGLLPASLRVALDSSPVRGRGALKDTYNLLSDAIAAVIRAVAKHRGQGVSEVAGEAGLGRHIDEPSIKGSEMVDWDNEESVGEFLAGLVDDCKKASAMAEVAGCATEEAELLKKIVEQDVEEGEGDEKPKIKRVVAKGRTTSVPDPESRHGRKTTGKTYTGHKAHVAVDTESKIITAVDVTAPGTADGAEVKNLIEQTEENTGSTVDAALGDCAYSSTEATNQAEDAGVDLKTPMPSGRKGMFGPSDFTVSEDRSTAECPAGHPSQRASRCHDAIVHFWSPEHCENCPFKEACTNAPRRTLRVPVNFHDRRRRERWAKSEAGRLFLRQRVAVEHAIGYMKNLGAGTARYFGRDKTRAQWLWTAAVVNLIRIFSQIQEIKA